MKKQYTTPTIEVVTIELERVFAGSNDSSNDHDQTTGNVGDKEVGDETPDFASSRRGTWGNLWE